MAKKYTRRQQFVTVITCSGLLALTLQQSMKTSSNRVATLKGAPIIATDASGSISTSDPLSAVDFITHAACQPLQCRHRLPWWWAGGLSSWAGWRPHLSDQSSKQNVPAAVPKISTRLIREMVVTVHALLRMASEFQDAPLPLMTSSRVGRKAKSVGGETT